MDGVHVSLTRSERRQSRAVVRPVVSLASLLLGFNSAVAFNPSSSGLAVPGPRVYAAHHRHLPTSLAMSAHESPVPHSPRSAKQTRPTQDDSFVIVGGGVSGIFAALTLVELGYHNVTILERELRVGGKAAAFEYSSKKYPLGAVGTPLALEKASFTEAQVHEKPLQFGASLLGPTGRRMQILDANNLILDDDKWPQSFPAPELLSQTPVEDWQKAFGAKGPPDRFYPHKVDFSSPSAEELASSTPLPHLVPRWGKPETSWPLVYVSAHGYGVAEAKNAPPFYYWCRFAQKSTNAGASGILGKNGPLGLMAPYEQRPIGPRGPALKGWDSTSLFEEKLAKAGVHVRTGATVSAIHRDEEKVTVTTEDGRVGTFDHLILAADLKGALKFLDVDEHERSLFSSIVHLPYYTVASFIRLPWLATGSVYYLGDKQTPSGERDLTDAGGATAGYPLILFKPNKGSDLTISWSYGGSGVGPPEIEARLRETVEHMNGTFNGIHFMKEWGDYFPHVPADELRGNFHKRLDALQGQKRTYMVGEIFNLPLVSECVDWARYLIRRHFSLDAVNSKDSIVHLARNDAVGTGHHAARSPVAASNSSLGRTAAI
mmetsp:Transcript_20944/g.38907  ORF Transcript_20944/g.38907 Transcript_20944/m.38907 type:complete len:602 (-) Transcript_20944:95-1900(-)